jgi:hypothetical protein
MCWMPPARPTFGTAPLALLNRPELEWEYVPELTAQITPAHLGRCDALYINAPLVTRASFAQGNGRTRIVRGMALGRFGGCRGVHGKRRDPDDPAPWRSPARGGGRLAYAGESEAYRKLTPLYPPHWSSILTPSVSGELAESGLLRQS